MENKPQEHASQDKKVTKVGSHETDPTVEPKPEAAKRKSFNINDAVKTLDLALGRLKKSKLMNEEYKANNVSKSPKHGHGSPDVYMDLSGSNTNIAPGIENASLMSMNFSHYELMRNLSCSTSNSEGTFSGTTCAYSPDNTLKNEHLEKFFRSAEMWTRKSSPNSVRFDVSEK